MRNPTRPQDHRSEGFARGFYHNSRSLLSAKPRKSVPTSARIQRGRTRASPTHAGRHVGQRQFHCGKPAAEARTRAVNRPIQDRRKSGSELGRQVPVDLQADADLNEGRGYP